MHPYRDSDVERICQAALDLDSQSRLAFIAEACAGDQMLRREVESLLAQEARAGGFMSAPAVALEAGLTTDGSTFTGRQLGPYTIDARLGAGGMGVVYRARDTKLGRDVAIKVLPPAFVSDPDRLARFQREAKTLAALNHPNIAAIHGLEERDGTMALVLELVEGPTLADRIAQRPVSVADALPIAKQIAEALEAAHELGIIHRDLKPANIKLRPDGTVKVLDFGLAKIIDDPRGTGGVSDSPTQALAATRSGLILGTAPYMSPEQARGKPVDKRADIWAFGCVLFEMLAGARAFAGDDVTETMVAVVSKEPDWQALPPAASVVRPLLARCLRKDPKRRLQAMGDARIQIEELISGASEQVAVAVRTPLATPSRRIGSMAIAALTGSTLIGAVTIWALMRPATETRTPPARFELVPLPPLSLETLNSSRDIAISPDGRYIAYPGGGDIRQLVVRTIDRLNAQPLAGTTNAREPFFSPDSRWIGFFDGAGIKKVSVTGGPVITICRIPAVVPRGASWGDDNTIVFATPDAARGLLRVPAGGGEPTVLTTPDAAKGEQNHWFPSVLPGSRGVLFSAISAIRPELSGRVAVAVLDLKTGQRRTLIRSGSQAEYLQTGHLVYLEAGRLQVVRFDLGRLEVLSDPAPVGEDQLITTSTGAGNYGVSRQGTLVYVQTAVGQTPRSLVWVDRKGQETPIKGAPQRMYAEPRLSPDASRVALTIRDQENDIWIWDFARETLRRLTFDPRDDVGPVWTADGQRIVFASSRAGIYNLFATAVGSGVVQRLTTSENGQRASYVAPDGTGNLGSDQTPRTSADVVWFSLKSPTSAAGAGSPPGTESTRVEPLVRTTFIEGLAAMSPNGRYLAYESNESGRFEIFVRPFPQVDDGLWQISTGGGTRPLWSRDGRELFYLDSTNRVMAVPVQTSGTTFAAGTPVRVLETAYLVPLASYDRPYDVAPDGQRFLMIKENSPSATAGRMVVVVNWSEELKRLVPTR